MAYSILVNIILNADLATVTYAFSVHAQYRDYRTYIYDYATVQHSVAFLERKEIIIIRTCIKDECFGTDKCINNNSTGKCIKIMNFLYIV